MILIRGRAIPTSQQLPEIIASSDIFIRCKTQRLILYSAIPLLCTFDLFLHYAPWLYYQMQARQQGKRSLVGKASGNSIAAFDAIIVDAFVTSVSVRFARSPQASGANLWSANPKVNRYDFFSHCAISTCCLAGTKVFAIKRFKIQTSCEQPLRDSADPS